MNILYNAFFGLLEMGDIVSFQADSQDDLSFKTIRKIAKSTFRVRYYPLSVFLA